MEPRKRERHNYKTRKKKKRNYQINIARIHFELEVELARKKKKKKKNNLEINPFLARFFSISLHKTDLALFLRPSSNDITEDRILRDDVFTTVAANQNFR